QVGVAHAHARHVGAVERALVDDPPAPLGTHEAAVEARHLRIAERHLVGGVAAHTAHLAVDGDLAMRVASRLTLDHHFDARHVHFGGGDDGNGAGARLAGGAHVIPS